MDDRFLFVSAVQIALLVLLGHSLVNLAWFRSGNRGFPKPIGTMLVGAGLLVLPALVADDFGSGAVSYINFLAGIIGGVIVGKTWGKLSVSTLNLVDLGLAFFAAAGAAQLAILYSQAETSASLHQVAEVSWGASNYVASLLIVASLALLGRAKKLQKFLPRLMLVAPALFAIAVSLLTNSRGAIVALGVGAFVLLWNVGRTTGVKFILRMSALVIPSIAYAFVENATQVRLQLNSQVLANVETRFGLWDLAIEHFLSSPIVGTGWASLRAEAFQTLGESQSFAHNIVLSFLQIGGFTALPFLIALVVAVIFSIREPELGGAIAAAVAISMTDPFFEGTLGAMLGSAMIVRALVSQKRTADEFLTRDHAALAMAK